MFHSCDGSFMNPRALNYDSNVDLLPTKLILNSKILEPSVFAVDLPRPNTGHKQIKSKSNSKFKKFPPTVTIPFY